MKLLITTSIFYIFHLSTATSPSTQSPVTKKDNENNEQKHSKRSLYEEPLHYGIHGVPVNEAIVDPLNFILPAPIAHAPIPAPIIVAPGPHTVQVANHLEPVPIHPITGGVYAETVAIGDGSIPAAYAPAFINGYAPSCHGPTAIGPIRDPLIQQTVEIAKPIPVPIVRTVPVPVPHPVPVPVAQPYPVHVPHPVPHTVAVPVIKHFPVPIERIVPVDVPKPYPVKIIKKIPVPDPYPVHIPVYKVKHVYHYE
ncbi:hypothetical protein PGB90_009529 [Kerria lacca]